MSPEIRFHFIFQIEHTLGMEKQERAGYSSWEAQQQGGRWISLRTGWNGHAAGSFAASRSFSRWSTGGLDPALQLHLGLALCRTACLQT